MVYMKKIFLSIFLSFLIIPLFAQVSINTEHQFYIIAQSWQVKGLIEKLPQVKPYPLNVVKDILETVINSDNEEEKLKANILYKDIFNKPFTVSNKVSFTDHIKKNKETEKIETTEFFEGNILLYGNYLYKDKLSLGYNFSVYGMNTNINIDTILPKFITENKKQKVGHLFVDFNNFGLNFDANGILHYGSKNTYLSLGFNNLAYGPFFSGDIVLNSTAFQFFNIAFNHSNKYFDYYQVLGLLGNENLSKTKYNFDKFFAFHSFRVPLFTPKLMLSYYEVSVFGNGFNPSYIMPVPYIILGNVSGFNENLMAGFLLEWNPVNCIKTSLSVLVDDFDPKSILKLKFDSGLRTALQFGALYTPSDSICQFASVNYTLVTPYTYTWYDVSSEEYNYNDYTNIGIPIGSKLPPNTDRVSLVFSFNPLKNLTIRTMSTLARHANAYESLTDEEVLSLSGKNYLSDGSVKMNDNGLETATEYTNFLNQNNIMYLIQGGISVGYGFDLKNAGKINFSVGYTFEYVQKDGIDKNIFSGTYTTIEEVKAAREYWASNLHNSYNHYLVLNFKYDY